VSNPPQLVLDANGYDLACNTGNTGRIICYATGGTKPYSFSLDNETWQDVSGSFNNLTDGTYTAYVKDYNECSVHSDEITITRPPNVADFSVSETEGCTPLKVLLTQENKGTTNYDFSNGEVLYDRTAPAEYTFVNNTNTPQTYTITASMLLDNNAGCVDKAQRQVTVYPLPVADFRIDNEKVEWPTNTASFVNLSKNITEVLWDFGDGTTSNDFNERTHQYEKCGNYNIVLVQSDGRCQATVERPFVIEGRPLHALLSADKTSGCEPISVNFKNTSINSDSCMWDFGDGSAPVYNSFNITHKYNAPGKFKAILTIYGDCGMQTSTAKDINVYTKPTAEFIRNLDTIYNGQTLKLECESSSTDHYIWDFGDGKSEEGSNKIDHLYSFDGTFNIKLIVTTANNCSDTAKSSQPVVVISRPIVQFPNAFTPNGDGINDRFMPIHGDIQTYKIEILNRLGVVVYVSENVNEGWDGTRHGKPCLPGMYVYKCKFTLRDKSMYYQKGNIFLLR
jgi:gliding motility-associated-like protein